MMVKYHCFKNPENGELSWDKADAKGHEGWEVVGEANRLPVEHEALDPVTRKLKVDSKRRDRSERRRKARDHDAILDMVEDYGKRIAALEIEVQNLKKAKETNNELPQNKLNT